MMSETEKTSMTNVAVARTRPGKNWRLLDKQVAQARALLRRMQETIEDIEDARIIERAKAAHGNKPRIPWSQVKKDLKLD
jgi:hypothetical protein